LIKNSYIINGRYLKTVCVHAYAYACEILHAYMRAQHANIINKTYE